MLQDHRVRWFTWQTKCTTTWSEAWWRKNLYRSECSMDIHCYLWETLSSVLLCRAENIDFWGVNLGCYERLRGGRKWQNSNTGKTWTKYRQYHHHINAWLQLYARIIGVKLVSFFLFQWCPTVLQNWGFFAKTPRWVILGGDMMGMGGWGILVH